jgi:hypothetical protein
MILETENRPVSRSGIFEETEFKISTSAHVMRILRTGVYSNKTLCTLREFASNSQDAHTEALIKDRPIEIQLPTLLEPTLKIRDFGRSMSHETVMELYSTYGLSTKSESNEYIGMMGIGKFAGFAYSPSFQVSCIQNRIKRVYNMYLNESDKGAIALLMTVQTEEEDGTEVSIEVKQSDVSSFISEARGLFRFWEPHPIIVPGSDYERIENKWHLRMEDWGFRVGSNGESYIVMGGVPYKINYSEIQNLSSFYQKLLSKQLVIFCKIGDVDVSASRENVSLTKKTTDFIKSFLHKVENEIRQSIEQKMDGIKTEYEARKLYLDLFNEQGELNIVKDIIKDSIKIKFGETEILGPEFSTPFPHFVSYFRRDKQWKRRITVDQYTIKSSILSWEKHQKEDSVPRVFYDLKERGSGKIRNLSRFYFEQNQFGDNKCIWIVQPESVEQLQSFCSEKGIDFGLFHDIDSVIQLPVKPRAERCSAVTQKPDSFYNCWAYDPEDCLEQKFEEYNVPGSNLEYCNVEFDSKPGYFLIRDGKNIPYETRLGELVNLLGDFYPEFKECPVIHVFSSRYRKKLVENGWHELGTALKNFIQKEWDAFKPQKINFTKMDYGLPCFSYEAIKALHEIFEAGKVQSKLISNLFELVSESGCDSLPHHNWGAALFCAKPDLSKEELRMKEKAGEIWKKMFDKTPLLRHIPCQNWGEPEVLTYIQNNLK